MIGVHADAETHPEDTLLARGEAGQNAGRGFLEVFLNGAVERQHGILVFDEIAKLAVLLVPDGGFERDRLLGDLHHLAHLLQRHLQLLGQFFGRGFAADLVQHLPAGAHQLVDRLDHMHRNTDGARLIRDRAGDGLPDPPCRIGREFVAAAVFELIDRLHQADIAFLNEIKELQATVSVFFGDRDHEAQIRLDHFLLGLTCFLLALLNLVHDAAEFADVEADILADLRHVGAQLFDLVGRAFDQSLPAATGLFRHPVKPVGIQLVSAILIDEFTPVDPRLIGQFHQRRVDLHHAAVDAVKLVDQRFDPVVVQMQLVHQQHDFGAQLLIGALVIRREAGIFVQRGRDAAVLHFGQARVVIRDPIKRFQHARLERGFHGSKAHVGLLVLVLVILAADRVAVGVKFLLVLAHGRARRAADIGGGGHRAIAQVAILAQLGAEGGFEVDHVAEQNVLGQKFVAPDGDGLKGQRAFAEPGNHRVAACLDPLGDGDLALAAQQFHAAHLAQIHADGVIGAVQFFRRARGQREVTVRGDVHDGGGFRLFVIDLVILDDVDAHFGQHRHHILDLLGRDLIGRQNLVQLIIGYVTPVARLGDHLLDRGLAHVEGDFGILIILRRVVGVFCGHEMLLHWRAVCRGRSAAQGAGA